MPTVRERKDGSGFYILANVFGPVATFQVSRAGERWLRRNDFEDGDHLDRSEFLKLHAREDVFTGGGGLEEDGANGHLSFDWARRTARARSRRRLSLAQRLFAAAFPRTGDRRRVLRIVARTIDWAHAINPMSWSTTLSEDDRGFLRLNVGRLDVTSCNRSGELTVLAHKPLIELYELWGFRSEKQVGRVGQFKSRRQALPIHLPAAAIQARYGVVEAAHRHVVCAMAYMMDRNPYTRAHSPGVLRYLRREGFTVPDPIHS
jgi:hypothetical protein